MITPEQIKHLDKLFAKDERGEKPAAIRTDEDYKKLDEDFLKMNKKFRASMCEKTARLRVCLIFQEANCLSIKRIIAKWIKALETSTFSS